MKPCSCGFSDILVIPNQAASGWGASSYTYRCRRCGATVTEATIDGTRRKWDRMMSKGVTTWRVRVRFSDGGRSDVVLDNLKSLVDLFSTDYRNIDAVHVFRMMDGKETEWQTAEIENDDE